MSEFTRQIESDVKAALETGGDIFQRVREITLKALLERELDLDNIKSVVEAAFQGVGAGLASQYQPAKEAFTAAAAAIDDALEKTAMASRLAIEEAGSRVGEFSQGDLHQATDELKNFEGVFLDTLENVARNGNELLFGIAGDFLGHARRNGTAVGKQAHSAFEALNSLRHREQTAILSNAANTAAMLARIGSGFLAGIAESLNKTSPSK